MADYRRSIFLINRKFQLRFAFYVCSWLFALSFVYPLIIYKLFGYFVHFAQMDPKKVAFIHQTQWDVLRLLVLFQVILVGLTFLMSIFMSHRIAGPIHKLKLFFEEARNGNFNQDLFFRKKDHFQELAQDYNDMMHGVRSRFEKKTQLIADVIPQIESAMNHANAEGRRELEVVLKSLRATDN